ncbi:MAG TPA: hypothetical protein VGL61_21080 [Kofleriaceae bacterium]
MIRYLLLLTLLVACRSADGKQPPPATGSGAVTTIGSNATGSNAIASGSALGSNELAIKEADDAHSYVPAEFKNGMARWKDTGVYVDGKPIGFLQFGELPIALKPVWVKTKVSQNKPPGCPSCLAWKWKEERFYRFTDYLKVMHVDLASIKMMHVYGPKLSQTIAVTGKDLTSPAAKDFLFRFGSRVTGKPIPHPPPNFGNGKQPDKLTALLIYIKKKPPIVTDDGIELDGVEQLGVPYYGEPLRGGVRIYLDDQLVTIIKRQELDAKKATKTPDNELHWSLAELLKDAGVDTSKVVEGWVIHDDRRQQRITWSDLKTMSFSAGSQAHGGVLLGDQNIPTNALALHTHALTAAELPKILPDEEP